MDRLPASKEISRMALTLYFHPFSSYSQKALIALYENDIAFESRVPLPDSAAWREFVQLWPMKKFPVLVDGERTVMEATCIIEYLGLCRPGPVRLIPEDDPQAALEVRMLDRFFDNYVSTPQQTIVFDALRPEGTHDAYGAEAARRMLETAYAWLDQRMARRDWAAAGRFSLADCAAAPSLFYADWTHPIGERHRHVLAYRRRLLQRPSFARAVDEARPYRCFFPLGAPDRD
jgi:glutathione S-transferase